MVWRSKGKMFRDGVEVPKPTITICGFGNNLRDAAGRCYCHGLAHSMMLHFRYQNGRLEYLKTDEPTLYEVALELDGWREVRGQ